MMYFPQLHVHTMYSLLDGLYSPTEWVNFCVKHNIKGCAITDHGNVHGILDFYIAAQKAIKGGADFTPVIGEEFYFVSELSDDAKVYHLIVLAKNEVGYKNLLKLSTLSYQKDHFYKKARITFNDLVQNKEGLIVTTACIGSIFNVLLSQKKTQEARDWLLKFKDTWQDDFYIEIQFLNLDRDWDNEKKAFVAVPNAQTEVNIQLFQLAKELGIKLILTNDCHYLVQEDKKLQDILIANSFAGKSGWKFAHDHYYFKSLEELKLMRDQYHPSFTDSDLEIMISNCSEIIDKCKGLKIQVGEFNLPIFPYAKHPLGDAADTAKSLIFKIVKQNKHLIPSDRQREYMARLKKEIELIDKYNLLDYFLIIEDILRYCRDNNIPYGPGRGSVGGSILAFLLGITRVDAIKERCIWERFLTDERLAGGHPPDIDIDFSDDERDKVRQYIYEKYGYEYVSPICTFGTLKIKSTIRDIARIEPPVIVFDFDVSLTDEEVSADIHNKAKWLPTIENDKKIQKEISYICDKFDLTPPDYTELEYFWLVVEGDEELQHWFIANQSLKDKLVKLLGNTRQVGIHASALAICRDPIQNRIPLLTHGRKGATERIQATQFNGKYAELAGAVKVDTLGLKTLAVIKGATELINQRHHLGLSWYNLPTNDPVAFFMLQKGWTETAFQYGSAAFSRILRDIGQVLEKQGLPVVDNEFGRLIIALNRPGPIQQEMDKQLVQNIEKPDKITHLHPLLQPILQDTYGIIIYQETVMEVCRTLGGFTFDAAEDARRAMGKKEVAKLSKYQKQFIDYTTTKLEPPMPLESASKLWQQIYAFSGYGFNRAHSCGYDFLAMQTLYLIAHYPLEWFTAILNKSPTEKIQEIYSYLLDPKFMAHYNAIKKAFNLPSIPSQIRFSLPDINLSTSSFQIVEDAIVMPLAVIKNVGEKAIEKILAQKPYCGLKDFLDRADCNIRVIACLIIAGAFTRSEPHKTVQQLLEQAYATRELPLPSEYANLDRFKELELRNEMLEFSSTNYRELFKDLFHPYTQELDLARHSVGMPIIVGGKILKMRKIKTKNAKEMCFVTIGSNNKVLDVTVFPDQFVEYRQKLRVGTVVEIHGKVNFYKTKNVVLDSMRILNG